MLTDEFCNQRRLGVVSISADAPAQMTALTSERIEGE
jgi:hypothetical protein